MFKRPSVSVRRTGPATRWTAWAGITAVAYTSPSLSADHCGSELPAWHYRLSYRGLIRLTIAHMVEETACPRCPRRSIVLLRNAQNPLAGDECLADYIAEGFRL